MKRILVTYKVKKDKALENKEYIEKVFDELNRAKPEGIKYASFQQPDGLTFVHIASIETPDGKNPLSESAAFAEFQKEIKERCETFPVAVELNIIGSYNIF